MERRNRSQDKLKEGEKKRQTRNDGEGVEGLSGIAGKEIGWSWRSKMWGG